jgi:hypothetical protein
MFCDFDSIAYVYVWMDVDSIFVCGFADVGPRGREVELVGEPARQGPVEPWVGERRRRDEDGARSIDEARAGRRHIYDDLGAGPLLDHVVIDANGLID